MRTVKYIVITTSCLGVLLILIYWITKHAVVGLLGYFLLLIGNIGTIIHAIMRKRETSPKEDISKQTQENDHDEN